MTPETVPLKHTDLRIRTVTAPEDIAATADLARRIWTEHYVPIIGAAQVEYMLDRFQSAEAIGRDIRSGTLRYDLALWDGRPAGYCAYRPEPDRGSVFLSKIYVEKDARGRGIARELLSRVEAAAMRHRCPAVTLTVNRFNTGALDAYRALGFTVTGTLKTDIGGGFVMDDYTLEKPLYLGSVPTEAINFRDPFVLVHDGRYYLYGTEGATCWEGNPGRMLVYTGTDLKTWDGPHTCFTAPPDFWADRNFWAPECHEYNGAFYLFVSFKSPHRHRGTQILRADDPMGPFHPVSDGPYTPEDWECLDGTLYVDGEGVPWSVFCHEWVQIGNGSMCAVPMEDDLTGPRDGAEPVTLFSAKEAPWTAGVVKGDKAPDWPEDKGYVTDGPYLYEMADGRLLMGWSSYTGNRNYTIGQAVSEQGITGPWRHMEQPVFDRDGGHGMFFRTLDGRLMMVIHQPNTHCDERPVLLELEETEEGLRIRTGSADSEEEGT